jgi:integrase
VLVLAYGGLRFGELAGLRVRDVNLMRSRLTVARNATEVSGRVVVDTPKTHRARQVPIPRSLLDGLAEQLAGRGADEPAFPSPDGVLLREGNWRRRCFDPAVVRCGLAPLTPHDLRHTAASLAISAGANVKTVQRMLGHASAAMTLDTYADLFDDDLDAVTGRLDEAAQAARLKCRRPAVGRVPSLEIRAGAN